MQPSKQAVGEAAFVQRLSGRPTAFAPSLPRATDEFIYRSADRQDIFLRTTIDDEISAVFGRFKLDRPAIVHLQPGPRFLLTFYLAGNIAGEAIGRRSKPLDFRTGYAHLRASNERRGIPRWVAGRSGLVPSDQADAGRPDACSPGLATRPRQRKAARPRCP